ncbi:hypothetical protein D0817_03955 [Flavobacterium cupreum]|uniref:Uncharacterized protein n=1 Tax=Flavobacterium cupreum TaxID=2133766 RepID=A0A434ABW7_9FLAO|nr:hypothetical protein D0817_03955 [Flavobacterium cupreum]
MNPLSELKEDAILLEEKFQTQILPCPELKICTQILMSLSLAFFAKIAQEINTKNYLTIKPKFK